MGRAPCCEKMGLKKGPWTPEEDQILVDYIRLHGHTNWRALPKLAGLLRCGKSCRLRWTNYLKPDIKRGNFTQEEEETIINLHQTLGNRWSTIAAKLPGRTDNEIKNVWHTYLKKRLPKSDPESAPVTDRIVVEPAKKRLRKSRTVEKDPTSKKLKSEQMNCMDTKNDSKIEDKSCKNDDDESNVSAKPQSLNERGPISPQPCTSEMSTVTSTSTSTSENDNRGKENVGNKEEYFDDFTEIDDDFWMEVLSVEDTAMSTKDLPCAFQYDPDISPDLSMTEPALEANVKGHGDDMDGFWYNLLTKSNEVPELSGIL